MLKGIRNLLAGLSIGAVLGIMFAPKKGSETRKQIKTEGLTGIKQTAKELGDDVADTATNIYGDLSKDERFRKNVQKVKKYSKSAKTKAKNLYKENVSPKDRKKIADTLKKTKNTVKKGYKSAKNRVNKLTQEK